MSYFNKPNPDLVGVRVVKYIRCSHDDQVSHGDTLEAQSSILDEFISANKMILVDTFADEALTARKKYTKRKEFVRLLDGVRAHDFDMIIFTKLDRWFRNIGDYHKIQEILEANSVQWKAVTENYDTSTTNGRLYINIRLSVAQDECDRDSDRIKDVFDYKLKNKTYISGSLPKGLKLDAEKHVVIDPEWKDFALDLFDHFEATNSKHGTQKYLKEKYQLKSLCYETVKRCLNNTLYKGEYRGIKDFCPALIDPDRFDRIQTLAKRDVRNKKNRTYLFTGLTICPDCGCRMTCQTTSYTRNGEKHEFRAYRCNRHYVDRKCPRGGSVNEKKLEAYMLSHIQPALESYIADFEISAQKSAKKDPAADASRIRTKLKKLYDLFMDDLIDKDMYREEYDKLQADLQKATAAPTAPQKNIAALKEILCQGWEEIYADFNDEEKAMFWRSIVNRIVLHESGEIDIEFL